MWLSLGPTPMTGPTLVPGMGIYGVLYDHVPGFDGVRVPARYAMIAGLFLALSAAFGARWLVRRSGGTAWLALAGVLIVLEGLAAPLEVNGTWGMKEATPPPRVYRDLNAPPVYQALAQLQTPAIVAEFPFGDPAWEIRYTYYAGMHRRRILNGYSGAFPPAYQRRVAAFNRLDADPAAAWSALVDAGATHVILHRDAFADPARANLVHDWLIRNGAHAIAQFPDGTSLFELRS
ncbi:MAG: hypothetical protein IT178_20115 [Acidobacteria bacterium]|nr:hypothetical protein [Acidobacteriota bacterium]